MVHHKLQEVLDCLDKKSIKRLDLFLQSPYFNQAYNATSTIELFRLLVKPSGKKLSKEAVSKKFFPNKPFQDNKKNPIDLLSSDLFKLVKQFINVNREENMPGALQEYHSLSNFYLKMGSEDRFLQNLDAWRKQLNKTETKDAVYYLHEFWFEKELAGFQSAFNTYLDDANLVNANKQLDRFFAVQKLELLGALQYQLENSPGTVEDEDQILGNLLLAHLEHLPHLDIAYVRLSKMVLAFFEKPISPTHLEALKQLLNKERDKIHPDHFRNFQAFYRYFYAKIFLKKRDAQELDQLFNLYLQHLKDGYFYAGNSILPTSFKLIINIGLQLGKYDWVEAFLEQHPPERIIGTRYPKETHQLSVADLHFYRKQYEAAIETLEYRRFENVKFSLLADLLLIKVYYETKNELIESRINALIQKNRRSPVPDFDKDSMNNFLRILERLLRLEHDPEKATALPELENRIRAEKYLIERNWILQKVRAVR